jgi:pimeloyl-ACP methyl ester carboxylesterase
VSKPAGGSDPAALFARVYQSSVDRWPVPVASVQVPTGHGTTHVLISGAETAPAVLLIPGGGHTATVWSGVAAGLSASYRVIAVDPVGQAGLSVPGGRPLRTADDLVAWLDQVLDGLGITRASLIGHSYGAWIALRYALHAPRRVSCLVLLDPTDTFMPLSLRYRLHSIPLLARPAARRMRRFLAWETRGRPLDEGWLAVAAAGQDLGRPKIVMPRCPSPGELADLRVPVLVIAAGRGRAHDAREIARSARVRLPRAATATIADATHHTILAAHVPEVLDHIEPFLAGETEPRR